VKTATVVVASANGRSGRITKRHRIPNSLRGANVADFPNQPLWAASR
jgi:hypothetical protein